MGIHTDTMDIQSNYLQMKEWKIDYDKCNNIKNHFIKQAWCN